MADDRERLMHRLTYAAAGLPQPVLLLLVHSAEAFARLHESPATAGARSDFPASGESEVGQGAEAAQGGVGGRDDGT
jgi:hypothetical protein